MRKFDPLDPIQTGITFKQLIDINIDTQTQYNSCRVVHNDLVSQIEHRVAKTNKAP